MAENDLVLSRLKERINHHPMMVEKSMAARDCELSKLEAAINRGLPTWLPIYNDFGEEKLVPILRQHGMVEEVIEMVLDLCRAQENEPARE